MVALLSLVQSSLVIIMCAPMNDSADTDLQVPALTTFTQTLITEIQLDYLSN